MDSSQATAGAPGRVDLRVIPFVIVHLVAFVGVFLVELRWQYVALCLAMYGARMFGITAGFHRYFAHRSFKTSRAFQFALAWLGTTAAQRGVLWWAAHHRAHHKYSDTPRDLHSPTQRGFWWAHLGWIVSGRYRDTDFERIKDFSRYPELVWLNQNWLLPPFLLAVVIFGFGGWGALIWGFFLSTVLLWHGTFTINSLAHLFGRRRYETTDTSRNSMLLALITLGEGWHNNHHRYQSSARQGFFWWEIDGSYYALKAMSWVGVVRDLREPPAQLLEGEGSREPPAVGVRLSRRRSRMLAAARLSLELFPGWVRERVANDEARLKQLPDEVLDRLARAGYALQQARAGLKGRIDDAERLVERLPSEIRALLPAPEELLRHLGLEPQPR